MIKWERFEPGVYQSLDERFRISKTWDKTHKTHWVLEDSNEGNIEKGTYHEASQMDCKMKAEGILKAETLAVK